MLLKSIQLTNLLSYGPAPEPIELRPLNVLIGPNGSGKSNFIDALELLHAAPRDLHKPIRDGGGVKDWLRKEGSSEAPAATLNAVVENPNGQMPLRYVLGFTEMDHRFRVTDERVENEKPYPGQDDAYFYYRFEDGNPVINALNPNSPHRQSEHSVRDGDDHRVTQIIRPEEINAGQSIFSQYKDPVHYPELSYLGESFAGIRIYREWGFGRYTALRQPQKADLSNGHLDPDTNNPAACNLGMVLNRMNGEPETKKLLLESLNALYDGIDDFHIDVVGGTVQAVFHEGRNRIPATRLSDGTLRYLCLLAILCDPNPGPLVCIEEPELGMHHDVVSTLADLIVEASKRTQMVITTHSDIFVESFHDTPEAILVADKSGEGTRLERLDGKELEHWLSKYSLGELWTRGDIGGNRW